MTAHPILSRIDAALDAGDFATLADCVPQLEGAAGRLEGVDLAALRAQALRLSRRLESAARGVQAARWRLAEIRAMGREGERLVTYDGQGQRRDTGAAASLTRRL